MVAAAAGIGREDDGREKVEVRLKAEIVQNPVNVDHLRAMVSCFPSLPPLPLLLQLVSLLPACA